MNTIVMNTEHINSLNLYRQRCVSSWLRSVAQWAISTIWTFSVQIYVQMIYKLSVICWSNLYNVQNSFSSSFLQCTWIWPIPELLSAKHIPDGWSGEKEAWAQEHAQSLPGRNKIYVQSFGFRVMSSPLSFSPMGHVEWGNTGEGICGS